MPDRSKIEWMDLCEERAEKMRLQLSSSAAFLEEVKMGLRDADEGNWVNDDELDTYTQARE